MSAQLNGQPATASDARFADLIAQAPIAISVLRGPDFVIETSNAAMLRIVGRGREIIGKPTLEAFPEVAGQGVWKLMQGVYHTGEPLRMDEVPITLVQDDGPQEGFYNISYTPLVEDGAISGILQMVTDVTGQARTRRAAEESKARFGAAIGAVQGILWTNDAAGKMVGEQPAWAALTGQSFEEYQGYGWATAVHPDDAQPTVAAWEEAVRECKTFIFEHRLRGADGSWGHYSVRAIPLLEPDGAVREWVGVHTDITEQRRAEEDLKYRQALLEAQNEAIPDASLIVNTKGGMFSFNRHFAEVWSIPEEIIARKDDAAALEYAMTQLVDPQGFIEGVNYCYAFPDDAHDHTEILLKDGRTIERWGNPVRGADGTRYGWAWYFRDVTAQKRVERELRLKDRAIEASNNGIIITGADQPDSGSAGSPIVYVNPAFERMTGYAEEEIVGQDCRFLQAGDRDQPEIDTLREAIRAGEPCTVVLRNYKKDGTLFYNELSISPVVDDGRLMHFVGVQSDITARMATDEALRKSEQRFRSVFNGQFLFLAILAPDGSVLDINELPLQAISARREDIVGKVFWDTAWWRDLPGMRAAWPLRLQQAAETDGPLFTEDRFQTATGETRIADAAVTAVRDADGAVEFFIVQASDVTERKKAEEALRESEAQFRDFSNNIQNLAWIANADGYIFWYNQRWYDYTGTTQEEMQGWGWEKVHHPEHIGRVVEFVKEAWTRDEPFEQTFPLRGKDGEYRWFLTRVEPVFDEGGKRVRWVGTNTDIHEQVRVQKELEENALFTRNIIEYSPVAKAVYTGPDFVVQTVNERMLGLMGRDASMVGQKYFDVMPELLGTVVEERLRRVWTTGETFHTDEERVEHMRHGEPYVGYYSFTFKALRNTEGEVYGIMDTAVEVTAQVAARKKAEESEARFRSLVEEALVATCLFVGRELRVEVANDAMLALWGKGPGILGMPLARALPELEGQPFLRILDDVFTTGEAFHATAAPATLVRAGVPRTYYFDFTYKPLRNAAGDVYAILEMAVEVTAQVTARRAVEESEQNLRNIILQAPVAMCILSGPQHIVTTANPRILREHWQKTEEEIVGKPFFEVVPEAAGIGFEELLLDVMETGVAHSDFAQPVPLPRNGGVETVYVNYVYEPFREADGRISGVMVVVTEVTDQVLAQRRVEESGRQVLSLFEQSPVGIALIRADETLTFEMANPFYGKMVDRRPEDIIGKPLLEALPEVAGQGFDDLLRGVVSTGTPYVAGEVPVNIKRGAGIETIYIDLAFQPRTDASGTVNGVLVVATDITGQVLARRKIEESEAYFRRLTDTVPAIIWITEPDGTCTYLNKNWYDYTGQSREEAEGFGWLDATHPDDKERTGKLFVDANAEHKPFNALYRLRHASGEYRWAIDSGEPKFGADGTYEGMIGTVVDVHEQQTAEEKVRAGEVRFRSVIEAAPVAIGLFLGRDLVIESPNQTFIDIVGKGWDVVGKPLREAMPELVTEDQPFLKILDDVFTTGVGFESPASQVKILRGGVMTEDYYNISYQPLFDEAGEVYAILDVALDVTEQVAAQQRVEKSEESLRSLVESAPFPIGVFEGREMRIVLVNQAITDIWKKGADIVGKTLAEVLPEFEEQGLFDQLRAVYDTGVPLHITNQRVDIEVDGVRQPGYYNYSFTPLFDASGAVTGVMNTGANITDVAMAKQQVEEAEAALRSAIELADLATWEVDAGTGRGDCSERLRTWIGVEEDEDVLSAFMQAVHPDDQPRVASSLQRAMELYSDGYYDEEYRLVNCHTGRHRIIHAQGKAVANAEGAAVRISGTAQDVTKERALQAELERQVRERTAELAEAARNLTRSNEELSQYAYVASHDLQEPLRKIQMFSGILNGQKELPEAARGTVSRISGAAERMSSLIQSLLEFSRLQKGEGALMRPVDLGAVVSDVVTDFELMIAERGAAVEIGALPVVEGVGLQMNQLFYNLVGNALKFSRPDVAPEVRIASRTIFAAEADGRLDGPPTAAHYHHVTVTDNGIGFEVRYAEQIFEVFKRLHGRDAFPGSGIGLALCRRIVANHGGALWAESEVGRGSTFNILLPVAGLS